MIGRCVPAGVLPDARIFRTSEAYRSGFSSLYLSSKRRGFLPGYRGRRLWTGGVSGVFLSTQDSRRVGPDCSRFRRHSLCRMLSAMHWFRRSTTPEAREPAHETEAMHADVHLAYKLVLAREPDREGLQHYTQLLARGLSFRALVDELLNS